MSEATRTKIIGGIVLVVAGWGIYKVLQLAGEPVKKDGKLDGYPKLPGKSNAASQVLHLMDKDYDYSDALKISVRDNTKGMSLNKAKQFKRKLEKELNRYI